MSPILGIWASASAASRADTGAMFPLQVITVGAAGASSITFTNIPATYSHLQIRCIARHSGSGSGGDNIYMQFNNDTGTNYKSHFLYGNGSSASAGVGGSNDVNFAARIPTNAASSSIFGAGVIDILDYANTNKYKTSRVLSGHDQNGSGEIFFFSGLWLNTNAITSIKLYSSGVNQIQYSQFALYAVKGAA